MFNGAKGNVATGSCSRANICESPQRNHKITIVCKLVQQHNSDAAATEGCRLFGKSKDSATGGNGSNNSVAMQQRRTM